MSVGIDIVDVTRIAGIMDRYGKQFLKKVFTPVEIEYVNGVKRAAESIAGRFAAKEAFIKAMGRRLPWRDIEVDQKGGRPFIRFGGALYKGVSISHERAFAVSVVMIEEER